MILLRLSEKKLPRDAVRSPKLNENGREYSYTEQQLFQERRTPDFLKRKLEIPSEEEYIAIDGDKMAKVEVLIRKRVPALTFRDPCCSLQLMTAD